MGIGMPEKRTRYGGPVTTLQFFDESDSRHAVTARMPRHSLLRLTTKSQFDVLSIRSNKRARPGPALPGDITIPLLQCCFGTKQRLNR
jgi:hypothetical protein